MRCINDPPLKAQGDNSDPHEQYAAGAGGDGMTTLDEILASTLTEEDALRNVANCVMALTEVTRYHNGKGRARTYNGDIDAIADAARQLADMVIMMLEGKVEVTHE